MNDFSSDKILDAYRQLNEISWRDEDVCSVCGMRFDEIGNDCLIPKCPTLEEMLGGEGDDE